jgi:hypothetical protein
MNCPINYWRFNQQVRVPSKPVTGAAVRIGQRRPLRAAPETSVGGRSESLGTWIARLSFRKLKRYYNGTVNERLIDFLNSGNSIKQLTGAERPFPPSSRRCNLLEIVRRAASNGEFHRSAFVPAPHGGSLRSMAGIQNIYWTSVKPSANNRQSVRRQGGPGSSSEPLLQPPVPY